MQKKYLDESQRIKLMSAPDSKVKAVLDTDTYNEIDDQFALVYSLLSEEKISLEAVYAAPFHNDRSSSPEDGMEKSYEEILRILHIMKRRPENFAFKGSREWLKSPDKAVKSDAAEDLVKRANNSDTTLYVMAIGAITNVASAIIMDPGIISKIVLIWLGGHARYWHDTGEFNMKQDIHASKLIMDCGVPLIRIPCANVCDHLITTKEEIDHHCKGKGALGDYLAKIYTEYMGDAPGRSKVLWDIAVPAWIVNQGWVPTALVHSPILEDSLRWSFNPSRHFVKEAIAVYRDPIFADLFSKLYRYQKQ